MSPTAGRTAGWITRCLSGCWPPGKEDAARLAARLQQRQLRPGETAFRQGAVPDGIWVVRSGQLELVAGSGTERVVVGMLESCGIAGDIPLLLGRPAVCTARALGDVQAGYLPAAGFLALLDDSPALARAWLTGLARRHFRAQQALAQTVGGSAESRTASLLLREARDGTVTYAQTTLAAMLGLRRPTLNRVLKEFEQEGLVRVGYRRVDLLEPDRLRGRTQGGP
ncbi:Crp/Fnr family transcriptional regulator [Streptomyces ardesiacus]|uniref:Crp/Fnr family transcriptional regulator n=1 Tax=Streptomyces ardesiacus TaxID=285564 RepID=UPI000A7689B2|nr:Crp/Fnr family transcriptional regulator [Streptomyces sp. NBRC 110030]